MQHFKAPGDCEYDQNERFVNRVRIMSDGRLDITYYPAGTLVPTMDMLDSVAEGVVEFGVGCPAYWTGLDAAFKPLWGLPFGLGNLELTSNLYWDRGFMDLGREIYAAQGVYLLGLQPICEYAGMMSTVPIYNLDDMKGIKVRTWGIFGEIVDAGGGAVVALAGEEIYLGLSTGVVEAAMWGGPGAFWDLKLHEVCKYITQPGWAYPLHNDAFINFDAWNELPDDLKEILDIANQLRGFEAVRCFKAGDIEALSAMQSEWGVTVCQWDDEAMSEAMALALPLWDEIAAASPLAGEAFAMYKDYMKELGLM